MFRDKTRTSVVPQTHLPPQRRQRHLAPPLRPRQRLEEPIVFVPQLVGVGLLVLSSVEGAFPLQFADRVRLGDVLLSGASRYLLDKRGEVVLLLEGNQVELLRGFGGVGFLIFLIVPQIGVELELVQRLLSRCLFLLFNQHVVVLRRVERKFMLLEFKFVPDRGKRSFLEENLRRRWFLMLDRLGNIIIPQPHRPVEVALCDIALVQQVSEFRDVSRHETFGRLLAVRERWILLHGGKQNYGRCGTARLCLRLQCKSMQNHSILLDFFLVLLLDVLLLHFASEPSEHILVHFLLLLLVFDAQGVVREGHVRVKHRLVVVRQFFEFAGHEAVLLPVLVGDEVLFVLVVDYNFGVVDQFWVGLAFEPHVLHQDGVFLEVEDVRVDHLLAAARDGTGVQVGLGVVGEVVESEVGEGVVLALPAFRWVDYQESSLEKLESQRKSLLDVNGIAVEPVFVGDLAEVESEMVIVEIVERGPVDHSFLIHLVFRGFDGDCHFAEYFESVGLGTVKDVLLFRVGDIVPEHHQQLVLLELIDGHLAYFADIPLDKLRTIRIVPREMPIHALLVRIAKNGPIQGLPRPPILKPYRHVVLHPQQGVIMEDLQFQYLLVVVEVVIIVEVLVESADFGVERHRLQHAHYPIVSLLQLLLHDCAVDFVGRRAVEHLGAFVQEDLVRVVVDARLDVVVLLLEVDIESQVASTAESYEVPADLPAEVAVDALLEVSDLLHLAAEILLTHAVVEDLVESCQTDDLLLGQQDQGALDALLQPFLLQLEQQYFAHHVLGLVGDAAQLGEVFLLVLEPAEGGEFLLQEGKFGELVEVRDDGGGDRLCHQLKICHGNSVEQSPDYKRKLPQRYARKVQTQLYLLGRGKLLVTLWQICQLLDVLSVIYNVYEWVKSCRNGLKAYSLKAVFQTLIYVEHEVNKQKLILEIQYDNQAIFIIF